MEIPAFKFNLDFLPQKSTNPLSVEKAAVYSSKERFLASVSYIYFVSVFILIFVPQANSFVKFHAKHALVLFLLSIISFLFPGWFRYLLLLLFTCLLAYSLWQASKGKVFFYPFLTTLLQDFDV